MSTIAVGFTATQHGITDKQKRAVRALLRTGMAHAVHHGDCIGGDEEIDAIARDVGVPVVIHPPVDPVKRAFCAKSGDVVWEPLPYLERNHDIVDETDLLIAAPRTVEEQLRSGTWATVRYAKKVGKPVILLLPIGSGD